MRKYSSLVQLLYNFSLEKESWEISKLTRAGWLMLFKPGGSQQLWDRAIPSLSRVPGDTPGAS